MEEGTKNGKYTVFVVEDSDVYRSLLVHALESTAGEEGPVIRVIDFPSGEKCLQYVHLQPDIVVLDHLLNGNGSIYNMDGLSVFSRIRRFSPGTDVVVVSCQENIEVAKRFLQAGAKDYIKKEGAGLQQITNSVMGILKKRMQQKNRVRRMRYAAAAMIASVISGLVYWLI